MTLSVLKAVSRRHLYQIRLEVRDAQELLTFDEKMRIELAVDLLSSLIEGPCGIERASVPSDELSHSSEQAQEPRPLGADLTLVVPDDAA